MALTPPPPFTLSASPIYSSKEVKVSFGLVRINGDTLRSKWIFKISLTLFFGLMLSILGQNTIVQPAFGNIFGTGYNAAFAGGGGGNQNGTNACPANMVAVGVGFTVSGNSPGFGVYCRTMGTDGQLVAQDQSTVSNTSAVGGGNSRVFCAPGQVVTGISFRAWTNVRIRCATPPALSDNAQTAWALAATGTEIFTNCSANGIVAGFYTRTGAWTDAIGAYCLPFNLNTLTYNLNGGSGTAPSSQTQTTPAQQLTVSSAYSGTRTGFTLSGWNTQANGLGVDYANGSSIRPVGATTLFARWTSTITYNGNTHTGGTVPNPTTAVSSAAVTKLANNNGNLVKTGYTFAGWNTAADGSGTAYSGYGYATPLLRYVASDYDTSTKVWTNSGSAGSGFNITSTNMGNGTGITRIPTTPGVGGSSNSFTTLKGDTTSRITFPNEAMSNYTLCHVARYAGAAKRRIFTHSSVNWLSGYLSDQTGNYNGVGNSGAVGLQTGDTNWHLICDYNLNFRNNGTAGAAAGRNSLPANIGVATWSTQTSDWEIAEVLFYDVTLGLTQIQQIEESLASTYGLSSYTSTNGTYASTGNITLYAQWNSTITYNGNGQTSATNTVPAATIAKGTAANTTLANAGTMTRTGYSFGGWNTQADGLGTNYASGLTTYQSAGNVTLYAKWTRTITYNSNGATSGSPERATDVFVNSTTPSITTFPTVGTMVKTGYTFGGWSTTTSGTALSTPYSTTGEVPLYARWTANTYTIVYDTSTVTSGTMAAMADTSFTAGTAFSLRANAFARTGYTFKNWNTVANGSGTTYTNSQSVTLYGGFTLYPQWTLAAPGVPTVSVSAGNTEVTVTPTAAAASGTTAMAGPARAWMCVCTLHTVYLRDTPASRMCCAVVQIPCFGLTAHGPSSQGIRH